MNQALDIRDVVRATGLTSRALRFYEARGLVQPLRTYSGRRLYGPQELERINHIVALKRAGLTLAQIASLTNGRTLDLAALIDAQLAALAAKREELEEARTLLLTVKSRIDRGEPVDAATFCSLIRNEDLIMSKDQWDKVSDRFFNPEQKAGIRANHGRGAGRLRSGRLFRQMGRSGQTRCGGDPAWRRQPRSAGAV
ncbi:MAG: MerR family transcriptional regulator [Sphingomicrobium sp.]